MSRVVLRVNTVGAKAGDVVDVDKAVAEALVANGHALPAPAAKADKKV